MGHCFNTRCQPKIFKFQLDYFYSIFHLKMEVCALLGEWWLGQEGAINATFNVAFESGTVKEVKCKIISCWLPTQSLGDDSFDMMIATQDELHGSTSGFDSMMQTVDDKATTWQLEI